MNSERKISLQTYNKTYFIERLLSALTYLTAGGVGFIWLIIAAFLRKQVTNFLMYHIMQSIFLSIFFFLVSILGQMLFTILYKVPLINNIPVLFNTPISFLFGFSIIQLITTSIMFYLAITSFLGFYSYLPWISDIIKTNTGQR